jgi:hypothetical protein
MRPRCTTPETSARPGRDCTDKDEQRVSTGGRVGALPLLDDEAAAGELEVLAELEPASKRLRRPPEVVPLVVEIYSGGGPSVDGYTVTGVVASSVDV